MSGFKKWFRGLEGIRRFIKLGTSVGAGVGAVAGIIGVIAKIVASAPAISSYLPDSEHINRVIFGVDVLVLFGFLWWLSFFRPEEHDRATRTATEQIISFQSLLCLLWLVQYVYMMFEPWLASGDFVDSPIDNIVKSGLNALPCAAIITTYISLRTFTVAGTANDSVRPHPLFWSVAVILITFVEAALQSSFKGAPIAADAPSGIVQLSAVLSGLSVGVAFALVVGRLDSLWLNISPYTIFLFYLFAVIQAAWPILLRRGETDPGLITVIFAFALIMKVVFFTTMIWLVDSKRMSFFLFKSRKTRQNWNQQFAAYLENEG